MAANNWNELIDVRPGGIISNGYHNTIIGATSTVRYPKESWHTIHDLTDTREPNLAEMVAAATSPAVKKEKRDKASVRNRMSVFFGR